MAALSARLVAPAGKGHLVADATPWVRFSRNLARNGNVDPVTKALCVAISSFEGAAEGPTRKQLAACIGRSVKTVDRHIAELEALGLLKVEHQFAQTNAHVHIASMYHLLDQSEGQS